jgi:hypothetical protein
MEEDATYDRSGGARQKLRSVIRFRTVTRQDRRWVRSGIGKEGRHMNSLGSMNGSVALVRIGAMWNGED